MVQTGRTRAGSSLVTRVPQTVESMGTALTPLVPLHLKPVQRFPVHITIFKGCFTDHLELNFLCSYHSLLLPAHPLLHSHG